MPVDPSTTTNIWQAFPDPDQFAALLNDMEGGRTNRVVLENNNPGNLKDSSGNFVKFGSWEEGRQALLNKMRDWQRRFPNMTIAEFNRRYAPDKSHGGDNADGTEAGRNQRMLTAMSGSSAAGGQRPGFVPIASPAAAPPTYDPDPSGQRPLTISDFANKIRTAIPQLNDPRIPDETLVGAALRMRPDLITTMTAASPRRLPEPTATEITPGERIGLAGLATASTLGNVALGATKRSAREALSPGMGEGGQGRIPGFLGSQPAAPVQLPPQEEAWARQFETQHPTLANLSGALPFQQPIARGIQQATTPTGTAQKVGQYIPDVVAGGQTLRELPGLARGAYRVASDIRANPLIWPNTAFRNILETVAPQTFRRSMQRVAGAGREPVLADMRAAQEGNLEALGKHEEAVANAERKYRAAEQKYLTEKVPAVKKENLNNLRQSKKEWDAAQRAHSQANQEFARISRDQEALAARTRDYIDRAGNNVDRTYKAGRGDLNYRWAELRELIRTRLGGPKGTPYSGALDSNRIKDAIDKATEGLFGSPENLTPFRQLTNFMMAEGGPVEMMGETPLRDLDWAEGLHYHNVLDRAIASESTPEPVKRALQIVQTEGLEPELTSVAEKARAGRIYAQLKRDHSQFLTDWSDPGTVTKGASPLRDLLLREDPSTFLSDVMGPAGFDPITKKPGRLIRDFTRYRKYGADPELLTGLQRMTEQAKDLKQIKIPEAPGMYTRPLSKPLPSPPEYEPPGRPNFRIPRPEQVRQQRISRWVGRPYTNRELLMLRGHYQRTLRHWLSDPAFQERVAQQLQKGEPGAEPWWKVKVGPLWRTTSSPP